MNLPDFGWLDMRTGPDTLDAIQRTLEDQWSRHRHVPDTVRMYLSIAAGEVGANIIEHAGGGRPINIRMKVDVLPERGAQPLDTGEPAV